MLWASAPHLGHRARPSQWIEIIAYEAIHWRPSPIYSPGMGQGSSGLEERLQGDQDDHPLQLGHPAVHARLVHVPNTPYPREVETLEYPVNEALDHCTLEEWSSAGMQILGRLRRKVY